LTAEAGVTARQQPYRYRLPRGGAERVNCCVFIGVGLTILLQLAVQRRSDHETVLNVGAITNVATIFVGRITVYGQFYRIRYGTRRGRDNTSVDGSRAEIALQSRWRKPRCDCSVSYVGLGCAATFRQVRQISCRVHWLWRKSVDICNEDVGYF